MCYSTLSIPLNLRSIKPCELRNFLHKQISPCELRLTWLPCGSSIRCFSHITEAVFAFLFDSWSWTNSQMLKRHSHYHYAISTYCDELTQLLNNLLDYTIQLTTYLLPCELLSRLLRYVTGLGFRVSHKPFKLHTSPWVQPLGPIRYPFSYQITKLVS